jgi:hypothetical protein
MSGSTSPPRNMSSATPFSVHYPPDCHLAEALLARLASAGFLQYWPLASIPGLEAGTVSADAASGPAADVQRRLTHPHQILITVSGSAALLAGAAAIWVAIELRITGPGWLAWLACALPPAVAGALCLARRRAASVAPAAVFGSCTVTAANAVLVPAGRSGTVVTASLLLLLCAGVAIVSSAITTAVLIGSAGAFSRRRAVVWAAAGLVFAALAIPSPVYVTGGPIQTIFAGNTGSENAAAVCSLILLAVPLAVAGFSSARMAAVVAVAWLPGAAAQPISWYVFMVRFLHLDVWYYATWLVWLAIVALTLVEARSLQSGEPALSLLRRRRQ